MSTAYTLAYRFGITPWERAGQVGSDQLGALFDREDAEHGPGARAVDLGCGRGLHAIELARRGWQVTGVDQVPAALRAARRRAAEAGQEVTFVAGDVTDLPAEVGTGYQLVLDIGCFHGLSDPDRLRMGRQVDALTAPGATMLVLCFSPGGRGPMPRGAGPEELRQALPGWSVVDEQRAVTDGMPAPLRHRSPSFFRLRRT